MKHFFAFCRRNRLFAALLAAELAVVCALAAGLFGAPYKLALTPGDFTNTLPDIAAADDDGLKIWNQIGYHSDDPMTFSADNIALPSGAYEVTVRYFSCQTPDAPTFNMLNAAGSLTFASERSPAAVTFDSHRITNPFPQDFRDYYERMLIAHADEGDIRNRNVIIANRIGIYLGHNSRDLQIEKIGEVTSTNMNGEETPTSLWRKTTM